MHSRCARLKARDAPTRPTDLRPKANHRRADANGRRRAEISLEITTRNAASFHPAPVGLPSRLGLRPVLGLPDPTSHVIAVS